MRLNNFYCITSNTHILLCGCVFVWVCVHVCVVLRLKEVDKLIYLLWSFPLGIHFWVLVLPAINHHSSFQYWLQNGNNLILSLIPHLLSELRLYKLLGYVDVVWIEKYLILFLSFFFFCIIMQSHDLHFGTFQFIAIITVLSFSCKDSNVPSFLGKFNQMFQASIYIFSAPNL